MRSVMSISGSVKFFDGPFSGPMKEYPGGDHWSKQRWRGDLVKTTPNKRGIYWRPTAYEVVDFTGGNNQYDYTYWSYGQKRRRFGSSATGGFNLTYHLHGRTIYGELAVPLYLSSSCDAAVRSRVVSEDWSLGQSLAELPETLRFIASTGVRVLKAYRAVRSGNVGAIVRDLGGLASSPSGRRQIGRIVKRYVSRRSHRDAASLWLEVSFAWKPLLSDIYNACKLASDGLSSSDAFIASATREEPMPRMGHKAGIVLMDETFEGKWGTTVSVSFKPTQSYLWDLQKLGLTNPAALAWELYPMSFVIDWFIPVGNFLEGLQQPFGVSFTSGYRTSFIRWRHSASFVTTGQDSPVGNFARITGNCFAFKRETYVGFPVPVPAFRGFGNLSGGQMLSILALLRQST